MKEIMSKKSKTQFVCQNCQYSVVKWIGKCPDCGEWNSFEEATVEAKLPRKQTAASKNIPKPFSVIQSEQYLRINTGNREFDRVMGGGIVPGSLTLIGGEPGVGKSTILLEVCGKLAKLYPKEKVLYISGEESESQVAQRSRRLGLDIDNLLLLHSGSWNDIKVHLNTIKPKFFVLDSIQTTQSEDLQSPPGTISQIREVTYEVMNFSKVHNVTGFIIGHVTKEGQIAGPKVLEHMVDTVVYFEGDRLGQFRFLRVHKNRFGNTHEVGIFEMGEDGLREVSNPSMCFLERPLDSSYGRSLSCLYEGTRPLLIEIQSLVVEAKGGMPRRTTQGFDQNRLSMIVAVIEKYFKLPIGHNDIYLNIVGGMKISNRECDLSIVSSLLSSFKQVGIGDDTVLIGEVGLTGEVRTVPYMENRLKELENLNYKRVITSQSYVDKNRDKFDIELIGIKRANEIEVILF
jgi:DNA repair protein RadA/Sms